MSDAAAYPDVCAHELFEQRAAAMSECPALLSASRRLSYGELARHSAWLARALHDDGVGPGTVVGLYSRGSVEAIVAVLAIFRAGGIVLPLDPTLPSERVAFMVQDSGAALVVTTADLAANAPRTSQTRLVDVNQHPDPAMMSVPMASRTLDDASFVLYTSGSTGRPKGVVRGHRAIVSRLAWASCQPDDVFCHNMSLNVGFSQERLFLPLMSGLPLAMIAEDDWRDPFRFVDALERLAVTQVTLVPDTLRQLLALPPDVASRLARLRIVAVGSAPLTRALSEEFHRRWPWAELVNAYGSTESGSIIRGTVAKSVTSPTAPIGRPVPGSIALILSPDSQVVPDGEVGELCVGGPSLAIGYIGFPELETDRFIRFPLGGHAAERLYRTGDLARRLTDGSIEVRGRLDRQIKRRGTRVELAEIEAVLCQHEAVAEAIVTTAGAGEELVAYVVWRHDRQGSESALDDFLGQRLPAVMVPDAFVVLDRLPKTPNAKVDVSLLPPPLRVRRVPHGTLETDTERRLAEIWQTVLKVDRVGRDDTFLDLGGDSLAATELVIGVQKQWGVELPLQRVLEGPGLMAMALAIDELASSAPPDVTPIPQASRADGAWSVPSILQQERLRFERWADARGVPYVQAQIRLLLELDGQLNVAALSAALNRVIASHDAFHATFPDVAPSGVPLVQRKTPALFALDATTLAGENADEHSRIRHAIAKRFDYDSAPLLDATLMRLTPHRHQLLIVVSHLVADALSLQTVQEDLLAEYAAACQLPRTFDGGTLALAPISYADFGDWQRTRVGDVEAFADTWIPHFTAFEQFSLDADPDAPANQDPLAAASVELELGLRDRARLAKAAAARRVTPYMMLLAAFALQLRAALRIDDIAFMLHFANRRHPQTRRLVGWLANSFPVGLRVSNDLTFDDVLEQVRQVVTTIDRHQHLPLPAVSRAVHDLRRARGMLVPDAPPLPPWPRVSFEMLPSYTRSAGGLTVRSRSVMSDRTEWGLRVVVKDSVDDASAPLSARATYSTRLLGEAYVRALLFGFTDRIVRVCE